MSRRRKTLCHAEIENFLSELQTDTGPEQLVGPIDVTAGKLQLTKTREHSSSLESVMGPEVEAKSCSDPHLEMKMRIRSFVRQSSTAKKQVESSDSAVSLAKTVRETYAYNLLPMRILQPEAFVFPAETIESKRAVLMSLGPMLDEAEKQRKIDVAQCEDMTRCRIESKRTRASWYQYSDVDSSTVIDPSEYEERYLKFLSHVKQSRSKNAAEGATPPQVSPQKASSGRKERKALKPISNNVIDGKKDQEHDPAKKVSTAAAIIKIASPEKADNEENVMLADDFGSPVAKKEKCSKRRAESHRRSSINSSRHGAVVQPATTEANADKIVSRSKSQPLKPSPTKRNTYAQIHRSPSVSPGGPISQNKSKPKPSTDKRRATLSPGKMKAMLDLALADDTESEDDVNFSDCNAGPVETECIVAASAEPARHDEEGGVAQGSSVTGAAAAELGDFLSSCDTVDVKTEEPIEVAVCTTITTTRSEDPQSEQTNLFVTEENSTTEYKIMATVRVGDSRPESPVPAQLSVDDVVTPSPDVEGVENEPVTQLKSTLPMSSQSAVLTAHIPVDSDVEHARDCPRDRARCRLFLRLEVARWRHAWEMASIDAVEAAVKRNTKIHTI